MRQVPTARTVFPVFLLSLFLAWGADAQDPFFVEQARFQPADLQFNDWFGTFNALSRDGDTALVAAHFQDCAASPDCGAAYVFARGKTGWVQEAKLRPAEIAAGDAVGLNVALSGDGDLALLGAPLRTCAAGKDCGAVYLFERVDGVWSEGQKLNSPQVGSFQYFGADLALSGDGTLAFVGSRSQGCPEKPDCGALHVFRRDGGLFVHQSKLTQPGSAQMSGDAFCSTIVASQDGETVLCHGDFYDGSFGGGSIYTFRYSGGTWVSEPKITSPGLLASVFAPLALSGDGQTLLTEETSYNSYNNFTTRIVAWGRAGGSWTPQTELAVRPLLDLTSGTLSFDGSTAVVGGSSEGPTRVFHREGGVWIPGQTLTAPDLGLTRTFVALSDDGRTVLLSTDGCAEVDCRGAAYIFESALAFSPDIPTVSEVGLALLALLLAGVGAARLRRGRV